MNDENLQQLVEDISTKYFGKDFRHRAVFNPRLRTTGGRYMLKSHNIEMNKKYYQEHGMEELIGIIKHELCHYHLHLEGKGYKHRDRDFKQLMKQVGAPRFCTPLSKQEKNSNKKILIYQCRECQQKYPRRKKVNTDKFVCGICKGRLVFVERRGT
ncbi:SprT-like protein [Oikeobacillus pervagus]|uniref:Protein SprT-like n=1 Tax=Oikeobacillus pervagus TaxID=1325931 RepID=A0AAJ1WKC4_9BACI|nr:SprT family protein [Oikeobacillus pervagus]MDQ0216600.1 SprT-like protein [Oikeobacillus pervagus]